MLFAIAINFSHSRPIYARTWWRLQFRLFVVIIIFWLTTFSQTKLVEDKIGRRKRLVTRFIPSLNIFNTPQQIDMACSILFHDIFNVVWLKGFLKLTPRYEIFHLDMRLNIQFKDIRKNISLLCVYVCLIFCVCMCVCIFVSYFSINAKIDKNLLRDVLTQQFQAGIS